MTIIELLLLWEPIFRAAALSKQGRKATGLSLALPRDP